MEPENTEENLQVLIERTADELILKLEKCVRASRDNPFGAERLLDILDPLCQTVEEILPVLHQHAGHLRAEGALEQASELKRKTVHIEDDLLPVLLAYIRDRS